MALVRLDVQHNHDFDMQRDTSVYTIDIIDGTQPPANVRASFRLAQIAEVNGYNDVSVLKRQLEALYDELERRWPSD